MDRLTLWLSTLWIGIALPNAALAYIGPGAGLSAIGTAIAVVGAFLLLVVGFVWYPMKRLLRKNKADEDKVAKEPADQRN